MDQDKAVDWGKYIESYRTPTILKELLIKPYFENEDFEGPVLDIGCGAGHLSDLLLKRNFEVIGVDPNILLRNSENFSFYKEKFENFQTDKKFNTLLLINVLSVLTPDLRSIFIERAAKLKTEKGKIYILTMNSDLYDNDFETESFSVKKLSSDIVQLSFKLVDGESITFNDNIITTNDIIQMCKNFKLNLIQEIDFLSENISKPIYKLLIFK